jgi:hypothetical protein
MRWRSAWLVVSSCVLLAGCGGSSPRHAQQAPKIPASVANQLAADADAVATTPGCAGHTAAVRLQQDAIAAISRVPRRYQEPIMTAANDIAGRIPACAPPPRKGPKPPGKKGPKHKPPKHGPHGHR